MRVLILILATFAVFTQAQMRLSSSAQSQSSSANSTTKPVQSSSSEQPEGINSSKVQPSDATPAPADTIVDTVYVVVDDGIPWNREFSRNKILRKSTFDPALSVAYTYSVSFMSGTMGTLSQTSYLAHLAYEFTPDLHLYADLGLWAPLYTNLRTPNGFAREDFRQGNVQFVLPDLELEYKPSENTSLRLMIINEDDYMKAYGPWRDIERPYGPRRNSKF